MCIERKEGCLAMPAAWLYGWLCWLVCLLLWSRQKYLNKYWTAMTFCADFCCAQSIHPNDFGVSLTFPFNTTRRLVAFFSYSVKYLNISKIQHLLLVQAFMVLRG